ncbi:MAG: hypothetical protein Q4E70_00115 [Candidatus Saccharibacteria bacterium]|nr:hypothetical protein [Candidatus Saccharibacteria bacterium]
MQNNSSNKILRDYVMKDDKKSEIFHSSGYTEAQNGENIGTASTGLSMAKRKALEEKRQFVAKYNNSGMFSETFSNRKAKRFNPDVNKTGSNSFNNRDDRLDRVRINTTGDANGNVRTGFGRSENARGIGEAGGYTPIKSGGGSNSAIKPGGINPSIRPKF